VFKKPFANTHSISSVALALKNLPRIENIARTHCFQAARIATTGRRISGELKLRVLVRPSRK